MNTYEKQVLEFHQIYNCSVNEEYSVNLLKLRLKLMQEELAETAIEINALINDIETTGKINPDNKIKMYKELADLQYVVSGTAISLGIPLEQVFEKVHASNMSKLDNGKPVYREDGKILKGPNYFEPDLSEFK